MLHVALFMLAGVGHANPMLQFANDLLALHPTRFTIFTSSAAVDEIRRKVRVTVDGATWVGVDDGNLIFGDRADEREAMNLLSVMLAKTASPHMRLLTPEFRQRFDFVVYDYALPGIASQCQRLGLTCYCFISIRLSQAETLFSMRDARGNPHHVAMEMRRATAVIVHSFRWLEEKALESMALKGLDVRFILPAVIRHRSDDPIKEWLDRKPPRSVVFVSLGSVSRPRKDQVTAFVDALENSKRPYIWSLHESLWDRLSDPIRSAMRTESRIIASWQPQSLILSHPSTCIFVSHCGWNSTLESMLFGVPILGFPLFGDQHMNGLVIRDQGVGIIVPKTSEAARVVDSVELQDCMNALANDAGIRKRCAEVRALSLAACQESDSALQGIMGNAADQWVMGIH